MDMEQIANHKLFQLLKKGLIYALVIYVFVILGRAIWLNWSLKKEIDQIKQEITFLENQNHDLENLIVYYQSDSFKELEARAKLGLQKPGETVVSIPVRKFNDYEAETKNDRQAISGVNGKTTDPNWLAWWKYIFE